MRIRAKCMISNGRGTEKGRKRGMGGRYQKSNCGSSIPESKITLEGCTCPERGPTLRKRRHAFPEPPRRCSSSLKQNFQLGDRMSDLRFPIGKFHFEGPLTEEQKEKF